jgi:hypothetical protein
MLMLTREERAECIDGREPSTLEPVSSCDAIALSMSSQSENLPKDEVKSLSCIHRAFFRPPLWAQRVHTHSECRGQGRSQDIARGA